MDWPEIAARTREDCCLPDVSDDHLCALCLAERHPWRKPEHSGIWTRFGTWAFFAHAGDQGHTAAAVRDFIYCDHPECVTEPNGTPGECIYTEDYAA